MNISVPTTSTSRARATTAKPSTLSASGLSARGNTALLGGTLRSQDATLSTATNTASLMSPMAVPAARKPSSSPTPAARARHADPQQQDETGGDSDGAESLRERSFAGTIAGADGKGGSVAAVALPTRSVALLFGPSTAASSAADIPLTTTEVAWDVSGTALSWKPPVARLATDASDQPATTVMVTGPDGDISSPRQATSAVKGHPRSWTLTDIQQQQAAAGSSEAAAAFASATAREVDRLMVPLVAASTSTASSNGAETNTTTSPTALLVVHHTEGPIARTAGQMALTAAFRAVLRGAAAAPVDPTGPRRNNNAANASSGATGIACVVATIHRCVLSDNGSISTSSSSSSPSSIARPTAVLPLPGAPCVSETAERMVFPNLATTTNAGSGLGSRASSTQVPASAQSAIEAAAAAFGSAAAAGRSGVALYTCFDLIIAAPAPVSSSGTASSTSEPHRTLRVARLAVLQLPPCGVRSGGIADFSSIAAFVSSQSLSFPGLGAAGLVPSSGRSIVGVTQLVELALAAPIGGGVGGTPSSGSRIATPLSASDPTVAALTNACDLTAAMQSYQTAHSAASGTGGGSSGTRTGAAPATDAGPRGGSKGAGSPRGAAAQQQRLGAPNRSTSFNNTSGVGSNRGASVGSGGSGNGASASVSATRSGGNICCSGDALSVIAQSEHGIATAYAAARFYKHLLRVLADVDGAAFAAVSAAIRPTAAASGKHATAAGAVPRRTTPRVAPTATQKERFAAAFRQAFIVSKANAAGGGAGGVFAAQARAEAQAEVERLRSQLDAVAMQRDRADFDLDRADKDVKRVRGELVLNQTRLRRTERELTDALGRAEAAEAATNVERVKSSSEQQRLLDELLQLRRDMEGLSSSHEQLQRQMQNAQRQNDADQRDLRLNLNARVDAAEKSAAAEAARCDALRAELDMRARAREDLENSLVSSAVEHNRVLQQLAKARSVVDDVRTEAADGVKRAAEVRNIERKEQLRFLEEGARLVAELRRYESLLVGGMGVAAPTPSGGLRGSSEVHPASPVRTPRGAVRGPSPTSSAAFATGNNASSGAGGVVGSPVSLHRSGMAGVRAWLTSLSHERYAPTFEAHGFSSAEAVARMKEDDLREMRVLAGHRRMILAAVEKLRDQLVQAGVLASDAAPGETRRAPGSEVPSDARRLLDAVYGWMEDFAAAMQAEKQREDATVRHMVAHGPEGRLLG